MQPRHSNLIALYRKRLGLDQPEFASLVGISKNTLQTWKKTGAPNPARLLRLVEVLVAEGAISDYATAHDFWQVSGREVFPEPPEVRRLFEPTNVQSGSTSVILPEHIQSSAVVEEQPFRYEHNGRKFSLLRRLGVMATLGLLVFSTIIIIHWLKPTPTLSLDAKNLTFTTWEAHNDGFVGPIIGPTDLESNIQYQATLSGTWNAWPIGWWSNPCDSQPEQRPQYRASGDIIGSVGIDAAYIFAVPRQASLCSSLFTMPTSIDTIFPLQISLDGGTNWTSFVPDVPGYNPTHIYTATLIGKGYPPQVRLSDRPTSDDNYGVITIQIDAMSALPR